MSTRSQVACPKCGQLHNLPKGKLGLVSCSKCTEKFSADTRDRANDYDEILTLQKLKKLSHPTEKSRFLIALFVATPLTLIGATLVYKSQGIALVVIVFIIAFAWFILQIIKASLKGSSVKVSKNNFPEVYQVLENVKFRLDYHKDVDVYITEGGSINSVLYKFFQTKFILVNSDVIDSMCSSENKAELVWLIGRFIGALKAKHLKLTVLALIVNSIQQLKVFNLLLLPYERATQYSGDQIGMALSNSLEDSISAFDKLMVGKDIAHQVQLKGLLEQSAQLHGTFFGFLAKALSTHPHMTDRYLNLIAFARYHYPSEFEKYIANFDNVTVAEIGTLLPKYHPISSYG